jgi:N-methylhydantoinase B
MRMTNRDVFAVTWQGGGGWGDPLDRDPEAVRADVISGAVSADACETIYGVRMVDGEIDIEATLKLRQDLRLRRVPGRRNAALPKECEDVAQMGPNLKIVRDREGFHVVSAAGVRLVSGSTCWRSGAVSQAIEKPDEAHRIALHRDLAMTAHYCPGSGMLLAVDVHEAGSKPNDDIVLDLTKLQDASKYVTKGRM